MTTLIVLAGSVVVGAALGVAILYAVASLADGRWEIV